MTSLHQARTFLFSHHFYRGLRVGFGVIGLTLATDALSNLPAAMTVSIGALCTSLMDLPSPLQHKFNEMLACALLCGAVTLAISLCAPLPWLLSVAVVLVSFLASLMVAFGKKTMPLQFAALFIMSLSLGDRIDERGAFVHAALVLAGGIGYTAYAMLVSWVLRNRIKQQILAEALSALARYLRIKAGFYQPGVDLPRQFNLLVRQQSVLAEKQQDSRDQLLRRSTNRSDAALLQLHFRMIDLYELILSTHVDYARLQAQYGNHALLDQLRFLIIAAADDIDAIAFDLSRKRVLRRTPDHAREIAAIDAALQAMTVEAGSDTADTDTAGKGIAVTAKMQPGLTVGVLQTSWVKLRAVITSVTQLSHPQLLQEPTGALFPDMTPFLSQQSYELALLRTHLRWQSPVFRYALRMALAVATGLAVAAALPYSAHAYWLILTIVVILKPSFSMTRQRRTDRLLGTMAGCVLSAVILHFFHAPLALLGFLFLATVAAAAFMTVKYRFTAIAASMQVLLQINLLSPGSGHLISERLTDTLIGAAIATLFSFVLPSWEYRAMPRLITGMFTASRKYLDASGELLTGRAPHDFSYRVARNRFMDTLAGLSGALVRMLDEPFNKQHAVLETNRFMVQNYLVVAHVAAIRLLLARHVPNLPCAQVAEQLQTAWKDVGAQLMQAETVFMNRAQLQTPGGWSMAAPAIGTGATVVPTVDTHVPEGMSADTPSSSWPAWPRLLHRLQLFREDAARLVQESTALAAALKDDRS